MTPSQEEWRPIPEWDGYYEASDQGRVRSVARTVYAGQGRYRINPSKVLAPQSNGAADDRRTVRLSRDGRVRSQRIAPLVLAAFVGPRPVGAEACHNDGDCANDVLSNLRWDDRGGNNRDAVTHGTHPSSRKRRCPRGHALASPNLVRSDLAAGRRKCLACSRTHAAAQQARKRGQAIDFQAVADEHYAEITKERSCPTSPDARTTPPPSKGSP